MDDERNSHYFLIKRCIVLESAVLAQALTVITQNNENSVVVESSSLILCDELLYELIDIVNCVQVLIHFLVRAEIMQAKTCWYPVGMVSGASHIKGKKRTLLRGDPLSTGIEHYGVFISEVVCKLKSRMVHLIAALEFFETQVFGKFATVLEISCG